MNAQLFTHIKSLLQVREQVKSTIPGLKMNELPSLENAWLWIENGLIKDYGLMDNLPDHQGVELVDCKGSYVLPAFVDPHTHLVFAQSREEEFLMRLEGKTYEEIASAGGGILNSALKLSAKSESELYDDALVRLHELISMGTGAVEIKSGYGLSEAAELKMLRVIKRLKENSPIDIKATFLGAHAFPTAFKNNHAGYIDLLINKILPKVADEGLADYIDAFCEKGYFGIDETEILLEAGGKYGLKAKIHVNQFTASGGVQLGVKMKALSVDHLEVMGDAEIESLRHSSTIPTILPSCSFFLGIPYAPARKLMEANLPLALGSDYNPGSTPSGNIPFLLSLGCIKQKMTPNEVINASTINSAAAIELSFSQGSITRGQKAKLIITEPMPNLAYWMYSFGRGTSLIKRVIV